MLHKLISITIYLMVCECRRVQKASEEWLRAKHATNQLMGRVELLFRPYLRWLDRSMEKLFTEGARQVRLALAWEYKTANQITAEKCLPVMHHTVSEQTQINLDLVLITFISLFSVEKRR